MWKAASADEKKAYEARSGVLKEGYQAEMTDYLKGKGIDSPVPKKSPKKVATAASSVPKEAEKPVATSSASAVEEGVAPSKPKKKKKTTDDEQPRPANIEEKKKDTASETKKKKKKADVAASEAENNSSSSFPSASQPSLPSTGGADASFLSQPTIVQKKKKSKAKSDGK